MKFENLFSGYPLLIIIIFLSLIFIINTKINLIITVNVENNKVQVFFNVLYLRNLINIKRNIYPPNKNKEDKKTDTNERESKRGFSKLLINDALSLYRLIKKVPVKEVRANIEYGSENISVTSFAYVFINMIYANIINFIDCDNVNLKVIPNYTNPRLTLDTKIHLKPKIKDIFILIIALLKIYRKNKGNYKEESNERDRVDTKSYGNNS